VVEDSEPFRRFICSTLRKRPELQIVGEVSDGLEAVQKAEELQPDLILLDIGLPRLNGIEAAQRIRRLSPKSKILFVSQESSADVVQRVLSLGACGYVVKTDAGGELLAAVDAVLRDEQFVGSRFAGHNVSGASDIAASDKAPEDFRSKPVVPLLRDEGITRHHQAQFYSDDAILLDGLTQFVEVALNAGNAAIVVATESHRDSLLLRLQAHGLDVASAIEEGRYIALDAAETLSTVMFSDTPDLAQFERLLGNLIATAAKATKKKHARVAVFGECVHLLCAQGNTEAAIQFEKVSNLLIKRYNVDIRCGYPLGCLRGEQGHQVFQQICAEHSAVFSQ
jgi:DNA-binding NarL/FixJ family response regulator